MKKYTLFPSNRRVPKRAPKKISKAHKHGISFDRLFREDRVEHFEAYVNEQLRRIDSCRNVESFNPRYNREVTAHADNKDQLHAEYHKEAD